MAYENWSFLLNGKRLLKGGISILLSLLCNLTFSSAFAQSRCVGNLDDVPKQLLLGNLYVIKNDAFEKVDINLIFEKKTEIDLVFSAAGLSLPSRVTVNLCDQQCGSMYTYANDLLKSEVATMVTPEWKNKYQDPDREISGPTFIHEYAHAVFWETLRHSTVVPFEQARALSRKLNAAQKEAEIINAVSANDVAKICLKHRAYVDYIGDQGRARLLAKHAELKNELERMTESFFKLKQPESGLTLYDLHRMAVPYTEFYSDLVGALVYRKPHAYALPVNPWVKDINTGEANRNFSTPANAQKIDPQDVHNFLSPSRFELYKLVWTDEMSDEQVQRILSGVFNVFLSDIEDRWLSGKAVEPASSVNARIIQKFRAEIAK